MSRGYIYQALQKLSGDWSAPEYARFLTKDILLELLPAFEMMDPLIRARLLLAAACLPPSTQDVMREQLQALSAKAMNDKEEWVSVIGRALSPFDGRAHPDAVVKGTAAVRDAMSTLEGLTGTARSDGMRPLEELYLSRRLRRNVQDAEAAEASHKHFTLREGALEHFARVGRLAISNAEPAPSSEPPSTASPAHPAGSSAPAAPAAAAASAPRPIPQPAFRPAAAKSAGMSDMFRSSRPTSFSRPAASAAAKPGQRSIKMLDVSEAIQRRNRPGMQHRRGAASSSPMHVSSPVRSQAPQSPAPHQSADLPKPPSPLHVASAPNSAPGQLPEPPLPLRVPRSPGAAQEAPMRSAAQQMHALDQAEQTQAPRSASANGSAPAGVMQSNIVEDMPDFDDEDEEGELPEDGEVPYEASQQSKRVRFEQESHHKPFRDSSPHEQHHSSATTLPYPAR